MTLRRIPLEIATPELRVVLACGDRPCVGTDAAVWSSDRRRDGSELDARMVCPVCATVHTVTMSLHVDTAALRCVGNAIQPQTAAVAWSHLVARLVRQAAA